MIGLYAMGSPNVVKVYLALEEMGLAVHGPSTSMSLPRRSLAPSSSSLARTPRYR